MKNSKKVLLAALALPLLVPTAITSAATPAPDTCPSIAEFSRSPVKYIGVVDGEDLFLNSSGNRVVPCVKKGVGQFYLLSGYKDGDIIYSNSNSKVWYGGARRGFIGKDTGNAMSYGDGQFRITDTHDFRRDFMNSHITEGEQPNKIPDRISIQVNPDWIDSLPKKYVSQSTENKEALIKVHYNQIAKRYDQVSINTEDFQNGAAQHIDQIKPSDQVINQYTLDKEFKGTNGVVSPNYIPVYGDIDGKLFLMYEDSILENTFLRSVPAFVLSVITDDSYTVNQRLALAHKFDTDPKFVKELAKEYREMTMTGYTLGVNDEAGLQATGLAVYKSLPAEERAAYNQTLIRINNAVYEKEFESLEEELSPADYRKLSVKDQGKYKKSYNEKGKPVYVKTKPTHTVEDKSPEYADDGYTKEVPDTIKSTKKG